MGAVYDKLTQLQRDAQNRKVLGEMYEHLLKADELIRFVSPDLKEDIQKALVQARNAVYRPKYYLDNPDRKP